MTSKLRSALCASVVFVTSAALAQHPVEITRQFSIQGQRAIDAIQRMTGPYSAGHKETNTDSLLIDSKKAVDEAKYIAKTARERYVVRVLQMSVLSFEGQLSQDIGTPEWKASTHRALQCETEAIYVLTPEQLSEKGKADARLQTCNKATDEWDEGITH